MKKSEKIKKLKKKIDNKSASDADYKMYAYLSRISGMDGMEKSLKDRIGRNLKAGEHTYKTIDKVFDRINNKGKENETQNNT